MLADKMEHHAADAWLINTGWCGGAYGTGKRISLKYSRAIIDAIHDGSLVKAEFKTDQLFKFDIPQAVNGVPSEILSPVNCWPNKADFEKTYTKLAGLFRENFKKFNKGPGLV